MPNLRKVFGTLFLPDAVWREVVGSGVGRAGADAVLHAGWIERRSVADAGLVVEALQQRAGFWLSEELRRMVTGA